jgi:hypothetical protein
MKESTHQLQKVRRRLLTEETTDFTMLRVGYLQSYIEGQIDIITETTDALDDIIDQFSDD